MTAPGAGKTTRRQPDRTDLADSLQRRSLVSVGASDSRALGGLIPEQRSVQATTVRQVHFDESPGRVERVSRPVMTGIAKRLGAEGVVTRTTDPKDARSTKIVSNKAGTAVFHAGRSESTGFVAHRMAGLDQGNLEILARAIPVLTRMADEE